MSPTNAIPEPGKTYKISLDGNNQILTATEPQGTVLQPFENTERQKWKCINSDKYGLGFQNVNTHKYLTFTDRGWAAQRDGHWTPESFSFTPLPSGGYQMSVTLNDGWRNCVSDYENGKYLGCEKTFRRDKPIHLYEV